MMLPNRKPGSFIQRIPACLLAAGAVILSISLTGPVMAAKPDCSDPNSTHPSCADGGGDDAKEIPLDCAITSDSLDYTLQDDGGGVYMHGQDNVVCRTGATGKVNLSGIVFSAFEGKTRGKNTPASRWMDLVLSRDFVDDTDLPDSIFEPGVLEHLRIAVRPYRVPPYYQTDIQSLEPDTVYPMALRINDQGNDWKINLAATVAGGDSFQGVLCNDNPDARTADVNVHVWPDEDPIDGKPDGYTVTTGTFALVNDEHVLSPGEMTASVCSNSGPQDCSQLHPQIDRWCNYLGTVRMQFTIEMPNQ